VIKPERDTDFYVGWSTVTENPHWWGDRAEAAGYLAEDATGDPLDDPSGRLDRADLNGTSAAGRFGFFGRWDYERFAYEQRGCLPRTKLVAAIEALSRDDESAVWDLLEPWEEGLEVRRG
jgi:hypothetical protein